ncbi:MAG: hypothetical protein ACUVTL_11190 [Thermoproteota archaeon]
MSCFSSQHPFIKSPPLEMELCNRCGAITWGTDGSS